MAGGVGSRFWPSSTENRPKQFLDILGVGKSLLRITYERSVRLVHPSRILVVTNELYMDQVQYHIPEIPTKNILTEPSRNNTGPSVAYTALHIHAEDNNAVFAILPSDHVIEKEDEYINKLSEAFAFADDNQSVVTLGIQPTRPDTGYGYIEVKSSDDKIKKIESFREKPDKHKAEEYLESGNYLWNAGMFVWKTATVIDAFEKHEPEIISVLNSNPDAFGTDNEREYINSVYPRTKKISIDYAILERADNVFTIPVDIGWSDLGTWNSLHAYLKKDENRNVIQTNTSHIEEVKNSLVVAQKERIVVIKGLDNFIVIDEPGALLIYPKDQEQEIKEIVKRLSNSMTCK